VQGGKPLRVNLVDAPRADRAIDHEPSLLEYAQMLGDGRPAYGQLAGELDDGMRAVDEQLEDRPARRIAERNPGIRLVSLHER